MSTTTRGRIHCEQAYAQGKMLDNSRWSSILPRKVTPSDVDLVFDNAGQIVFAELSRHKDNWRHIAYGQWKLYQNLIQNTGHVAVLLKHGVDGQYAIDTAVDVEHFQLMVWDFKRRCFAYSRLIGGDAWVQFIARWFEDDTSHTGRSWSVLAATVDVM